MTNKPDSTTRQRILKAALGRFAYSGYAAVSVREIVADAQVTKPTLYYYFKSKAGLYQALVDWAMAIYGMMNIYVMADLVGSGPKPNRQTAKTIVQLYLTGAAKKTGCHQVAAV